MPNRIALITYFNEPFNFFVAPLLYKWVHEKLVDSCVAEEATLALGKSCEAADEEERYRGLDELERMLLAKFDVSHYRPKHTGRFLTMHKRRRKRLVTRSLDQEPGLLDDVAHGQVQVSDFFHSFCCGKRKKAEEGVYGERW